MYRCKCLQSKEKHNGEVSYKESGDVVLNLSDTSTTQSTQPSDEVVIQMLPNGGSQPKFSYNTLEGENF